MESLGEDHVTVVVARPNPGLGLTLIKHVELLAVDVVAVVVVVLVAVVVAWLVLFVAKFGSTVNLTAQKTVFVSNKNLKVYGVVFVATNEIEPVGVTTLPFLSG